MHKRPDTVSRPCIPQKSERSGGHRYHKGMAKKAIWQRDLLPPERHWLIPLAGGRMRSSLLLTQAFEENFRAQIFILPQSPPHQRMQVKPPSIANRSRYEFGIKSAIGGQAETFN